MGGHIAVVLPGAANGPYAAPLLVPLLAVEEAGGRVEVVTYPEFRPRSLERQDAVEFDAFVGERVAEVLARERPSRVTFIAKSLGTLFLAAMGDMPLPADVGAIWVTPLLGLDYAREASWTSGGPLCSLPALWISTTTPLLTPRCAGQLGGVPCH